MKIAILTLIFLLGVAEYFVWQIYSAKQHEDAQSGVSDVSIEKKVGINIPQSSESEKDVPEVIVQDTQSEDFPAPVVEIKNGITERTVHVGVRRYTWDPKVITVKKGEKVHLIIHNADVKHGMVIPAFGVNADIPEDGAIIDFVAEKVGTFEFFCSVWCGEGHMEMQGKIVVQ